MLSIGLRALSGRLRAARRGATGSGMAISVAIMFPALMLVIVSLQMLTEAARTEQALQAAANRAARTASLCCYATGDAAAAAQTSIEAAQSTASYNQVYCNNDLIADSSVVFVDVDGAEVPDYQPEEPVPPGGVVYVFLRCQLPPRILGGYGFPGLDVHRTVLGTATVDPYRFRHGG